MIALGLPLAIGTTAGRLGISVILWANAPVLATALIIVGGADVDCGPSGTDLVR